MNGSLNGGLFRFQVLEGECLRCLAQIYKEKAKHEPLLNASANKMIRADQEVECEGRGGG